MSDLSNLEKREDKLGVYLYCLDGETVSLDNMLNAISYIENDGSLPRELRIIEIALDTVATFRMNDVKKIYLKMKEVAEGYTYIKHAVVHNSKINTAFGLFVEHLTRHKRYELRVFSSIAAAEKWLLVKDYNGN